MSYIPYGPGEIELHRTEVKYGHVFILTNRQIILVQNPSSRFGGGRVFAQYSLREISTVRAEAAGFLSSPSVVIRLSTTPSTTGIRDLDSILPREPVEIRCRSTEQANELASSIRAQCDV